MKKENGFAHLLLLIGAAIIIISIIGGVYYINRDKSLKTSLFDKTNSSSDASEFSKIISKKFISPTPEITITPILKKEKPTNMPTPFPTSSHSPISTPTSKATSTPTPKPTATPTSIPQPTPITCFEPINYPSPLVGHMTFANWWFNKSDINSISNAFFIYNDPGENSDFYLQLYDGKIDDTSYYFGVQTIHLVIFSRFGITDTSNIRTGPNAYKFSGTNEGDYISLRLKYDLGTGGYVTRLKRAEFDGVGDWFDFYIGTEHNLDSLNYVGGIRFPRKNSQTPASLRDGGGSWVEFWDNNNPNTAKTVPLWHIGLLPPFANDQWTPEGINTRYSTMPNSDIYYEKKGNILHMTVGASTPRCNPAAWINL